MLKFFYHPTPNPMKVALFLAETGMPFELVPVDTAKGEQHAPEFRAINPNGKVPAILDGDIAVFDSTAILIYLSEKTGQFGVAPEERGALLSWLMFVATGLGPFSGQSVHFHHVAPEDVPYAKNRYMREIERHYQVLNDHLKGRENLPPKLPTRTLHLACVPTTDRSSRSDQDAGESAVETAGTVCAGCTWDA